MNRLLDHELDRDDPPTADREISLGAGTILGIFFALALLCAVFFGFGYTLGRKSAQSAPAQAAVNGPAASTSGIKPAAGSAAATAPPLPAPDPTPAPDASSPAVTAQAVSNGASPADAHIAGDPIPASKPVALPAVSAAPAISPGGTFMVQIAAVSTQEIADIEQTALKKYGYDVSVRREPQDQLLHVQIGPFATRKDAEAMRQNVLAHGFNAIVK
jgi:cell division septation protein DedD